MENYLTKHTLQNVWCAPREDHQWVYEPYRITSRLGALITVNLLEIDTELPDTKRSYHVFQIGQLDPLCLNLLRQVPGWAHQQWFKFSDVVNTNKMEITLYDSHGLNFPRTDAYYIFTSDRCLFVAVPSLERFKTDLGTEPLFIRFYRNPYTHEVLTESRTYKEFTDVEIIEERIKELKQRKGIVRAYVNGVYHHNPSLSSLVKGDFVEWVYDSANKRKVTWRLSDLNNFRSLLDNEYKYLLHYPGDNQFKIDYQDDIDIHILIQKDGDYPKGLYYNRNFESHHRMVTHKDYSISTDKVLSLANHIKSLFDMGTVQNSEILVEASIRHGGEERILGYEHNRIRELYKLDDRTIQQVMLSTHSTVPTWYAPNLEASKSMELLRRDWTHFDSTLIEEGYGYNAISKILGDTPIKVKNRFATLNPVQSYGSTVFEYDEEGKLLGYSFVNHTRQYVTTYPNTALVEVIAGQAKVLPDTIFKDDEIPYEEGWDDIIYYKTPSQPQYQVADPSLYTRENGILKWISTEIGSQTLAYRNDRQFLCYETEIGFVNGYLQFEIMEGPQPSFAPYAHLDIWLNGYKLIRGLDYFVKYPKVVVTNTKYLLPGEDTKQKVTIRAHRLNKTTDLDTIEEFGWVHHGSLSHNSIYDVREDRVLSINIGGRTFHRSDLEFSESNPTEQFLYPLNGLPYQIKDIVVPFRDFVEGSSYTLRIKSQEVDKQVSDFLTEHYGVRQPQGDSAIGNRHSLYSPFLAMVIYALQNNHIRLPEGTEYSDSEVRSLVTPYLWLLDFDPIHPDHQPDIRYAYVTPHAYGQATSLEYFSYVFFDKVMRLYGYEGLVTKDYIGIVKY